MDGGGGAAFGAAGCRLAPPCARTGAANAVNPTRTVPTKIARKLVVAAAEATGAEGAAVRARFQDVMAAHKVIVDFVLKGSSGDAGEYYMTEASGRYVSLMDARRAYRSVAQGETAGLMERHAARATSQLRWRAGLLALLLIGLGAHLRYLRTRIVRTLGPLSATLAQSGIHLSETAAQVTASSQSVSHDASRQAASIEETSPSLEEIGAMARQNAEHAREAKALAAETTSAGEAGRHRGHHQDHRRDCVPDEPARPERRRRSGRRSRAALRRRRGVRGPVRRRRWNGVAGVAGRLVLAPSPGRGCA